jgi:predicted permease
MHPFTRFRSLFRRSAAEADLTRELEFHLAAETEANIRAGLSPTAARDAALRSFGGITQTQEECRDAWGVRFWDNLRQDLNYAWRGLRHNSGFAFVVVLILALGIGANTAIFSMVQGVLLRDLPYTRPNRLVLINQAAPKAGQPTLGFSVPDFMDFRARNRAFTALAEYHSMFFILLGRTEPERVQTGVVSDNFFDLLGVQPLLGRAFLPGEDKQGAAPVLMLSYDYWQHSFGGDPKVIGQVFEMNNKPHTVVGVLPPLPAFPNADQVFMPASACPFRGADAVRTNRNARLLSNVFGRLKDGVNSAQALDDARRVGVELCGEFPQAYPQDDGYTVEVQGVARAFTGEARQPLFILLAMSGFVLLIACANVANLTLSRLVRRNRELAVRLALGAGRGRIFRQLLTESTLLALLGGAAGLLLAAVGLRLLVDYAGHFLPRANEISINGPVLSFTLVVSLLTGLLFGSRPPLPANEGLVNTLKDGARGASAGRNRLRSLLVVGQVAISVPLLIGAGLAARSLYNLSRVDPGLDTGRVLAANISLNWTRLDDFPKRFGFWTRAIQEVQKIPGVQAVAVSGAEPLNGLANNITNFRLEHQPAAPNTPSPHAIGLASTEDYFRTVGQKLLRGRYFLASDTHEAAPVAIVNQSLASRHWPGQDPIGQRITFDNGTTWATIVGVVANARQQLDAEPQDEVHVPLSNTPGLISATVLLRTNATPAALMGELRAAIHHADPQQPITSIETLEQVRESILGPRRLIATLLGLFALLALVITAAGIGGVLAFSVGQRTQEIGIRMALGANRREVLWMVLRQALALVGTGLALGTLSAFFLSQLIASLLYAVPPNDPVTFAAVALALLAVTVVACLWPARCATVISPITALRTT